MAQFKLSEVIGGGYNDWWTTRKFYRICKGSKGSKKTRTTALWFIWHMMKYPQANTLVVRRFKNTLESTVYADMLWAIDRLDVADEWKPLKSPLRLVHTNVDPETGKKTQNVIMFAGMDDPLKLAGSAVRYGYLCWVWFEEMYDITNENEFDKLVMSIRGKIPPETGLWKQITGTFNPWSENTWIKKRFFDEPAKNVFSKTTTYKCNEWLGDDDIERYEDMYRQNPRMARIICDGDWGIAEGLVYENWYEEEFDPMQILAENPNAKPVFGLDFGFSVSYNAFVAMIVDPKAHKLWVFDEMYERNLSNLEIAKRITNMGYGKERITADCAEPKSIYELQIGQIEETFTKDGKPQYTRWILPNVEPAMKGPDSIRNGIRRMQSFTQIVHPRCVNYKMELNNYCFDQDKDGKWLDKPIKEFDHCLVAGTLVMTDHGQVPIEDIRNGDMVLTHLGYRPVISAGITQLDAEIWRLECEDGTILEGTGNHPLITNAGVVYMRDAKGLYVIEYGAELPIEIQSDFRRYLWQARDPVLNQKRSSESLEMFIANTMLGENEYGLVKVKSIENTGRREIVYDLTVAESHDFFANSLITSNCMDAARMALDQVFIQARGHVVEAGTDRSSPGTSTGMIHKRVISSSKSKS